MAHPRSIRWLLVGALAAPGGVGAQSATERGRQLALEGKAAFDAGDPATAAARFEEAWRIDRRPNLLLNAARAYEAAGALQRALDAYDEYLRVEPQGLSADEARAQRTRLAERIARQPLYAIVSSPPGAAVYLDEAPDAIGVTPLRVPLTVGPHTLRFELPEHAPRTEAVVVSEGTPGAVQVELAPVAAPTGALRIRVAEPGWTITLDGERWQSPVDVVHTRPVGPARVAFTRPEGTHRVEIDVIADGTADVPPPPSLAPPEPAGHPVGLALGLGGVAVLVGGAVVHGLAWGAADDADALLGSARRGEAVRLDAIRDRRDEALALETGAWVMYGAGLVLGGLGLWSMLDDPAPAEIAP